MNGKEIERIVLFDGASFQLFKPRHGTKGESALVVMLTAIAGVNDYMLSRANNLCADGYTVAVLDYFGREGTVPDLSYPQFINAAVARLDDRRVLRDLDSILLWANHEGFPTSKVGLLGFCIGGTYAVLASAQHAFGCAVDYYGQLHYASRTENKPVDPFDVSDQIKAPLLCHYGDWDRLVGAGEIEEFTNKLRAGQKPYELFVYKGAPHAFDEWFRPAIFRAAASKDAWQRTLSFLNWHLHGQLDAS